jgi:hypothetical protein
VRKNRLQYQINSTMPALTNCKHAMTGALSRRHEEARSHASHGMWLHAIRIAGACGDSSVVGIKGIAGGTYRANEVRLPSFGEGPAQATDMCVDRTRLDENVSRPYGRYQVVA